MHQPFDIIAKPRAPRKPGTPLDRPSREELLRRLWADHNPDGSARR